MLLRAESMPLLEIFPEDIGEREPVAAWIWDGGADDAKRLMTKILPRLRRHLTPDEQSPGRVKTLRRAILESLFNSPHAAAYRRA